MIRFLICKIILLRLGSKKTKKLEGERERRKRRLDRWLESKRRVDCQSTADQCSEGHSFVKYNFILPILRYTVLVWKIITVNDKPLVLRNEFEEDIDRELEWNQRNLRS